MRLVDGFPVEGHVHAQDVRRAEQATGVLLQAEDAGAAVGGVVGAHALEHTQTVVQRVRHHVRARLAPGHQLAVEPDHAVTIVEIHVLFSPGLFTAQQRIPHPHDLIAQRLVFARGHDVVLLLKGESMNHGAIGLVGLGEHPRVG